MLVWECHSPGEQNLRFLIPSQDFCKNMSGLKVCTILALLFANHIKSLFLCHRKKQEVTIQMVPKLLLCHTGFCCVSTILNICQARTLSLGSLVNPYASWQW